ncbi:hypothetical protein LK10_05445 [Sinomonas humi]|uniref:Uncharacterized protein n=1 Tax=Sinomonas humi TaxID=1338436 RepID=A0A0B2AR82_9MICC|nr:hypothetical protein LK10_05445 [Sinomonas humi]
MLRQYSVRLGGRSRPLAASTPILASRALHLSGKTGSLSPPPQRELNPGSQKDDHEPDPGPNRHRPPSWY